MFYKTNRYGKYSGVSVVNSCDKILKQIKHMLLRDLTLNIKAITAITSDSYLKSH